MSRPLSEPAPRRREWVSGVRWIFGDHHRFPEHSPWWSRRSRMS
ncbi:hypothetical protein OG339_37855 [Streptosporangium sp. NBC_01495]|nr:hypothetical protein [Streptosporangium sp. NBC_01495]